MVFEVRGKRLAGQLRRVCFIMFWFTQLMRCHVRGEEVNDVRTLGCVLVCSRLMCPRDNVITDLESECFPAIPISEAEGNSCPQVVTTTATTTTTTTGTTTRFTTITTERSSPTSSTAATTASAPSASPPPPPPPP
ncbi:hypothetical protein GWK47_002812 [Chionoecetes opilio]|uniref:Uncharacterized protein n=1 Tax=Chionoecetes opilio TaxID=41210 RepID=A0A8J5CJ01_CHIOP|nr:hypothetical protein GWK47_002812 [Chionoecetes opilio]